MWGRAGRLWELSVSSLQFHRELKTALKNKGLKTTITAQVEDVLPPYLPACPLGDSSQALQKAP